MMEQDHPGRRRRNASGEATRELLMVTAERLLAVHGIDAVTLRQIQDACGQSNGSVISYHFGSKEGLVRAIVEFRYRAINARRAELLDEARAAQTYDDARTAVQLIVRPLIESIADGEMFVPLLAQVSATAQSRTQYLPHGSDLEPINVLRELLPSREEAMPPRARLAREVQLYSSVLTLLGDLARTQHRISEAHLSSYLDGWVGMLEAPLSPETAALLERDSADSSGVASPM